jgi:hypothetical protein
MYQAYITKFYLDFIAKFDWDFYIPSRRIEGELGYDLELSTPIPFFLQLKVSAFFEANSRSSLIASRRNFSYRDSFGFFRIPWWDKGLDKKQHNLLFSLKEKFNHQAFVFYVAPLFYEYRILKALIRESHYIWNNYNYVLNKLRRPIRIFSESFLGNDFFILFPFLRSSIYIEPHDEINDSQNHFYTYNFFKEVAFHSEEGKPVKGSIYFDYEIILQLLAYAHGENKKLTLNRINDLIIEALSTLEREPISKEVATNVLYGFPQFLEFLKASYPKFEDIGSQLKAFKQFLKENLEEKKKELILYSFLATYLNVRFNIKSFLLEGKHD